MVLRGDELLAFSSTGDMPGNHGGTTLLAVRPDAYIGMRCERDHLTALDQYDELTTKR